MVCRFRGTFMVRSLTFAVALALGTVSVPVHALGLGDIKTSSALNQEFNAEIALLSVAKGELDGVRVRLAGPADFERAGIERPFYLTLLKFKPERLPDGRAVIRVRSDFPIREPFLNFLVEVNWPKGRLIREYTVLLDPPVTTKRRAPAVQTAPARVSSSRAAATPRRMPPPSRVVAGSGEYGPVSANETLWSIARKLRPSGASMEQMMIALHRANPRAFIRGDINRLKRGQVLRVPSDQEVLSLPRAEARRAYREAQAQWLARRSERMQQAAATGKRPGTPVAGAGGGADEVKSELRIATARPEGRGEAGASEIRGDETVDDIKRKLLLARENAEASRLESEALRGEVDELQKRLEDMRRLLTLKDEQLARLQAQAEAAGDAPAEAGDALDAVMRQAQEAAGEQLPDATGAEEGGTAEATGEPAVAEETSQIADDLIAAADAVVEEKNAEGISAQPVMPEPAAPAMPAGESTADTQPQVGVPGEETPPPADETSAEAQVPAESGEPAAEDSAAGSMFDDLDIPALLRDNLPVVAGAGGALVLLLILLGVRRKRAREEEDQAFDELAASTDTADATEDEAAPVETEAKDETESAAAESKEEDKEDLEEDSLFEQEDETSFLSEFTPSDMNALRDETGEVDPIAEADVYIAYGRYQQVEDLLKQALNRDPDRLALKHKLLEVYYATRNVPMFNELAESMVENGQDIVDPDAWARVCDMGRELAPDNNLYHQDNSSQVTSEVVEPVGEQVEVDVEATARIEEELNDLATLDDLDGAGAELAETVDEPSLDLDDLKELEDLDDLDTRPLEGLDSLDLDLSSVENVADDESPDDTIDLPTLDIGGDDDDLGDSASATELKGQLDELGDLSELEDDLSRLARNAGGGEVDDLSVEADEEVLSALDKPIAVDEDEDGLSALDKPLPIDEAFDKAVDEEIDISSLATDTVDAEAVDTKLDLARAFLEMGDAEGAKDILDEIRQEGNDAQREEAEKLLAELS